MKYLNDEQHYVDLYDLLTIKECLGWEKNIIKGNLPKYNGKKIPKEQEPALKKFLVEFPLYFIKGENYIKKAERIREWTENDRQKQEKYDNATEPLNISCLSCGDEMRSTSKELYDFTNESLRVLFFFECPTCKKRRGVFDTGEEFKSHEQLCPKCQYPVKTTVSKREGKAVWTTKCSHCDYKNVEVDDFDEWKKQRDKERKEDEALLQKYRGKYCLPEKEGQEFIHAKNSINQFHQILEDHKRKETDPAYGKAKQLKKLSVIELEKLLNKVLEKEKYIKLILDKPEIGLYVIVPFTVQDADTSRKKYDSTHKLQKVIKAVLEKTNWRLMSEGISYRLGYVYGRLKGYEREEDLANLVRKIKEQDKPLMETEDCPIY